MSLVGRTIEEYYNWHGTARNLQRGTSGFSGFKTSNSGERGEERVWRPDHSEEESCMKKLEGASGRRENKVETTREGSSIGK